MDELEDHQLLADFARTGSETAFAVVVGRYVNLVYSAALRFTGNPHHAEEITQATFIVLSRKAGRLSSRVVLSGWLYQAARLTAANFVKGEIRRQRREQEVYMQSTLNEPDNEAWHAISPLLDEAMGALAPVDRDALVLRYFENRTAAEIGAALRMSEEAARKRVNRALDKLHRYFIRHGVSSGTAAIAGAISAHSVHAAPMLLAKSVTAVAAGKGAAAGGATLVLAKTTANWMVWAEVKIAVVLGAAAVLLLGTTGMLVSANRLNDESIDQKIARLSRPGTTARDVIRVLGEPEKYGAGQKIFFRDHLPASYQMVYTNAIQVWIMNGKVKELEALRPGPAFSFHGRLRLGSTLDEVLQEVGPPSDTITGQAASSVLGQSLGGYAGVLYQNLDGTSGYCYYWRPDQNVRFIFRNNTVVALLLDVNN